MASKRKDVCDFLMAIEKEVDKIEQKDAVADECHLIELAKRVKQSFGKTVGLNKPKQFQRALTHDDVLQLLN